MEVSVETTAARGGLLLLSKALRLEGLTVGWDIVESLIAIKAPGAATAGYRWQRPLPCAGSAPGHKRGPLTGKGQRAERRCLWALSARQRKTRAQEAGRAHLALSGAGRESVLAVTLRVRVAACAGLRPRRAR
jgi:hypothetical protein